MRLEFLQEGLMVAAQMAEQGTGLALPIRLAFATYDCTEATGQDLDAFSIMPHCISEFRSEQSTLLIKVRLILAGPLQSC